MSEIRLTPAQLRALYTGPWFDGSDEECKLFEEITARLVEPRL